MLHGTPIISVFAVICDTSIAYIDIAITIDFRYIVGPQLQPFPVSCKFPYFWTKKGLSYIYIYIYTLLKKIKGTLFYQGLA